MNTHGCCARGSGVTVSLAREGAEGWWVRGREMGRSVPVAKGQDGSFVLEDGKKASL
jgi:hypothetical protein